MGSRALNSCVASLFMAACTPALAETPLTGSEFEAYTTGKTMTYFSDGASYGIEEYKPDRHVKWAFRDGECTDGRWFEPEVGLICFVYNGNFDAPQCWNFFKTEQGLMARFLSTEGTGDEYQAQPSHGPLVCLGPEVGV